MKFLPLVIIVLNIMHPHCFAIIIPAAQQTTDVVPDSGEIEMKRCDAYDVAGKCKLVKNQPVYEEVV